MKASNPLKFDTLGNRLDELDLINECLEMMASKMAAENATNWLVLFEW